MMAPHIIRMPDIGEGIAEVDIAGWHVRPGDFVSEDQVLADVMTDKASVEIPSPVAGRVLSLGGEEGDTLAVGAPLVVLERFGATPLAQTSGQTPPAPVPQDAAVAAPRAAHAVHVQASPSVRRRARALGIDLAVLAADGNGGPVSHAALDRHLLAGQTPAPGAASMAASVSLEPEARLRLSGLRRQIARRMAASARQIPHFSYVEAVDVTALEQLRQQLNAGQDGSGRARLSLLPFLARALVLALKAYPALNAHFDEEKEEIVRFSAVHLGVAAHTDQGLMVPVVHDVQTLDPWACAARIAALSNAARQGQATRAMLSGSTITLSSLGALGGIAATPIINAPEVAIVGVNRIRAQPVAHDGGIAVRQMMNLSSSFDHRVIDGMDAARFIQHLRRLLESPALLFVDGWP